jgi:molecular chaperone DnaK (HSP70)
MKYGKEIKTIRQLIIMLYLDIGIDLGGSMQPILLKDEKTPTDYELKLAPMNEQKEIEVGFYEGQRALVKDNHLLGKILLTHNENLGPFVINIHVDDGKMTASIENTIVETFVLSNEANAFFIITESHQYIDSDNLIKEREKERQELKEYIYSTLYTLKQIDQTIIDKTTLLDIIYKAEDVSYMDITVEEIRAVQKELEGNVNLFMNKNKKLI